MCPKIIGYIKVAILRLKKTNKIQHDQLNGNLYVSVLWYLLQYANSTLKIMSIVPQCSEPQKDRRAKRVGSLTFYHLRKAKAMSPKIPNHLHILISIVLNY